MTEPIRPFPSDIEGTSLAQQAQEVEEWLRAIGGRAGNDSNRFLQLCKTVRGTIASPIKADDPNFSVVMQAIKDIQELWFIVRVLRDAAKTPPFLERIQRLAGDPLMVKDRKAASPGRDTQFELFVGAIAHRTGLKVESAPSGPDWVLTTPTGQRLAIETKRSRSSVKVFDAVGDAAKQIKIGGCQGAVIIDISLIDDNVSKIVVADKSELERVAVARAEHFRTFHRSKLAGLVAGTPAQAIVLYDYVLMRQPERLGGWGLHSFWNMIPVSDLAKAGSFEESWELFATALPSF